MHKRKDQKRSLNCLLKGTGCIGMSALLLMSCPARTNSETIIEEDEDGYVFQIPEDELSGDDSFFEIGEDSTAADDFSDDYSIVSDDGDEVSGISDFEIVDDEPLDGGQEEESGSKDDLSPEGVLSETETSIQSGECGKQEGTVFWSLDAEGVLHIYGEGSMNDWASPEEVPWYAYADRIKEVDIGEDITDIGSYAFSACALKTGRFG